METEAQIQFSKQHISDTLCERALRQEIFTDAKSLQKIKPLLNNVKSVLEKTYRVLAKAAKEKRELTLAAEWLIDNFYIIQEQIVGLKQDMPPPITENYRYLQKVFSQALKSQIRLF